jgi:hypothetical protein
LELVADRGDWHTTTDFSKGLQSMGQIGLARNLFDLFADDLLAERNARPLIIVGAAKIDDLLLEMLRAHLLPKMAKAKDQDELLEGDTPLSTFSARIKICRRLGLIDGTLYVALERLRAIRNLCAHSISFDHAKSPTREYYFDLKKHIVDRGSYLLTRKRYFASEVLAEIEELQCLLLTLCVLLEAIRQRLRTTKGNRTTLQIAAR